MMPPRLQRWLLHLYPRPWRERYGAEVADLLASSPRPLRDVGDLLVSAAALHYRDTTERIPMRALITATVGLLALGTVWTIWATPQLARGIGELHDHWWSAPALLLLGTGLVLGAYTLGRHHRTR